MSGRPAAIQLRKGTRQPRNVRCSTTVLALFRERVIRRRRLSRAISIRPSICPAGRLALNRCPRS